MHRTSSDRIESFKWMGKGPYFQNIQRKETQKNNIELSIEVPTAESYVCVSGWFFHGRYCLALSHSLVRSLVLSLTPARSQRLTCAMVTQCIFIHLTRPELDCWLRQKLLLSWVHSRTSKDPRIASINEDNEER